MGKYGQGGTESYGGVEILPDISLSRELSAHSRQGPEADVVGEICADLPKSIERA